ncbi:HtaA domain-containing protein [Phytomonospora sp. NPDC050363]|uniref:HtaA domain-containing protein n=1 Tax=Phytomonospora sp. NPDC050363 TaxID=3155642 RepID=UPI0033DDEC62
MSARVLRTTLAALLTAALVAIPGQADAADSKVSGGRLDWGLKTSFQNYITGPIAKGEYRLTGGAATAGSNRFRFHSATGAYDPGSGDFTAGYSGGVRFTGHKKEGGDYELDLLIANPKVEIAGGGGTLYVDVTTPAGTSHGVAFADLGVGGLDTSGGTTRMELSDIPATLTAQGAKSFAGYYEAGTELDPLSLTADMSADKPDTKPSTKAGDGEFSGAAVDWGVRRTYREYVVGDIAKGSWSLTEGAQDGGALFRFGEGKGFWDARKKALDAAFTGAITFTGQGLDLTLTGLGVTVAKDKGTLTADVTSAGATTEDVPLVTFAAKLSEKDGLVRLDETPTVLTAKGAAVFGGFYPAGTDMDPLWLAVPVKSGAELPPLPDLGEDVAATQPPASIAPAAASSEVDADGFMPAAYWIVAAVALAAVAATVLLVRRRRPVPESTVTEEKE